MFDSQGITVFPGNNSLHQTLFMPCHAEMPGPSRHGLPSCFCRAAASDHFFCPARFTVPKPPCLKLTRPWLAESLNQQANF